MENKNAIEQYVKQKFNEWGLTEKGWTFEWDRCRTSFGKCRIKTKRITLSSVLIPKVGELAWKDTVLHEIAHALDFHQRGTSDHGRAWKLWAMRVGANPIRCSKGISQEGRTELARQSKYTLRCPNGHVFPSHRQLKRRMSCGVCCQGSFNENFVLTQTQNY